MASDKPKKNPSYDPPRWPRRTFIWASNFSQNRGPCERVRLTWRSASGTARWTQGRGRKCYNAKDGCPQGHRRWKSAGAQKEVLEIGNGSAQRVRVELRRGQDGSTRE